jgi:serine/threonine protein kinase
MERIGRYINLKLLTDDSGHGEIYIGEHELWGGTYAIKVLQPTMLSNPEALERFKRECKILFRFRHHPNIISVLEPGYEDGRWYLPMEYIRGEDLRKKVARTQEIPFGEKLRWTVEIMDALQVAHDVGVVHRDIKPTNIRVKFATENEEERAIVLDFGIAHETGSDKTTMGQPGTYGYRSPEQILGKTQITAQSDIFSAGIVFYELFTGRHPFRLSAEQTATEIEDKIRFEEPLPLGQFNLPEGLVDILVRALRKEPADRFRSAGEMRDALEKLQTPTGDIDELIQQFVKKLLEEAKKLIDVGQRQELIDAHARVEAALKQIPEHSEALSLRTKIAKMLEELEEVDALIQKIDDAIRERRLTDASTMINRAIDLRPWDSRIVEWQSRLKKISEDVVKRAEGWLKSAEQHIKQKKYRLALQDLDRILTQCPIDCSPHRQALELRLRVVRAIGEEETNKELQDAINLAQRGEMKKAEQMVCRLLQRNPGDPWIIQSAREAGIQLPGIPGPVHPLPAAGIQEDGLGFSATSLDRIDTELRMIEESLDKGTDITLDLTGRLDSWERELGRLELYPACRNRAKRLRHRVQLVWKQAALQ